MDDSIHSTRQYHKWLWIGLFIGALVLGLGWAWVSRVSPDADIQRVTTLQASENVSGAPLPVVGVSAPDFTLKTLDGSQVGLSDYRGQPVLINFWASWCLPCRVEMPELVRAYETHKAEGFVILGINLTSQDSLPDVQAFVKEFGMTFPVLLDETGDVAINLYQLPGLPMSVFVDRNGLIARIQIGAMTSEQIDEFVAEILK